MTIMEVAAPATIQAEPHSIGVRGPTRSTHLPALTDVSALSSPKIAISTPMVASDACKCTAYSDTARRTLEKLR